MRIAILGAGAIGILFGSQLYASGNEVTLYNRNPTIVRRIREHGVRVREDRRTRRFRIPIGPPPKSLSGHDLVIVTTKAYDTKDLARKYSANIGMDVETVLTLQNGLGNYEVLARHLGRNLVVAGSTTEAALALRPGLIVHTGHGETWIGERDGEISSRCKEIAQEFDDAGFLTRVSRDIRAVLWTKAVINSAVNPVSALAGLPNGELARHESLRRLMKLAIQEGATVAKAEHVQTKSPDALLAFTIDVLKKTAKNRSSMLQDIEAGRPTEIQQLNGAIVRYARLNRLDAPLSRILVQLVTNLEKNR